MKIDFDGDTELTINFDKKADAYLFARMMQYSLTVPHALTGEQVQLFSKWSEEDAIKLTRIMTEIFSGMQRV